ncbi:hypothetical protein EJB05_13732, partial [Eragrostis curvula]
MEKYTPSLLRTHSLAAHGSRVGREAGRGARRRRERRQRTGRAAAARAAAAPGARRRRAGRATAARGTSTGGAGGGRGEHRQRASQPQETPAAGSQNPPYYAPDQWPYELESTMDPPEHPQSEQGHMLLNYKVASSGTNAT